jgi:hypothetical protein
VNQEKLPWRLRGVKLFQQHEYLFGQILHNLNGVPLPNLCKRLRKKLGPLWRQHFELAECLWDGPVLRWIPSHGVLPDGVPGTPHSTQGAESRMVSPESGI